MPTGCEPINQDPIETANELLESALRIAVETLPAPLRPPAGYQLGWWDRTGAEIARTERKNVRPLLTMLAAEATGGNIRDAVAPGAAVELVHNFSLLHDDVMDQDEIRRGRPAAWTVFGVPSAILVGDALLVLAFQVLAGTPARTCVPGLRLLQDLTQQTAAGQQQDLHFELRPEVTLQQCLDTAAAKTGALFEAATGLGALYGGASAELVNSFRRFGRQLGVAFQLVDDVLGIWGDPDRTGKPVLADLRRRKRSLPVVAALTGDHPAGRKLAELYLQPPSGPDDDVDRIADLIEAAGGQNRKPTGGSTPPSPRSNTTPSTPAASPPSAPASPAATTEPHPRRTRPRTAYTQTSSGQLAARTILPRDGRYRKIAA